MNQQEIESKLAEFCREQFGTEGSFVAQQVLAKVLAHDCSEREMAKLHQIPPPEGWEWAGEPQEAEKVGWPAKPNIMHFCWLRLSSGVIPGRIGVSVAHIAATPAPTNHRGIWRSVRKVAPPEPTCESVYGCSLEEALRKWAPGRTGTFRIVQKGEEDRVVRYRDGRWATITSQPYKLVGEWRIVLDPLPQLPDLPEGFRHRKEGGEWAIPKDGMYYWYNGPIKAQGPCHFYAYCLERVEPQKPQKRKVTKWLAFYGERPTGVASVGNHLRDSASASMASYPGAAQHIPVEVEVEE